MVLLALFEDHALEAGEADATPLPSGWRRVPSRTRPGEVSYFEASTGRRVKLRPSA